MSAIILKILSVIGIILLVLLGILLLMILLVLFFPISYRLKGYKTEEETVANAKVDWLFGLFRVRYSYPEPGRILVKLLCFTLTGNQKEKQNKKTKKKENPVSVTDDSRVREKSRESIGEVSSETSDTFENETSSQERERSITEKLSAKYEKIKYTIFKIYDKIKWIWEHITFYKELWEEQETQELLKYALERLSKIWKNVKPKRLEVNLVYGAASPDTTGYIYAIYGMLCSYLGEKVFITPDFSEAILEGDFHISGRITVFVLLWNALKVAFDKRLKRLIHKVKRYEARQKKLQKAKEKEREKEFSNVLQ